MSGLRELDDELPFIRVEVREKPIYERQENPIRLRVIGPPGSTPATEPAVRIIGDPREVELTRDAVGLDLKYIGPALVPDPCFVDGPMLPGKKDCRAVGRRA